MCVVAVSAQQKITGEVVDADGYAIPLASAMYKGHHVAVVSDIEGKVVRILPIGAFVEIAPGHDGMVHISKLENRRVEKVEDVLNIGDMTWVKVMEIDEKGRVNLSRKDALKELAAKGQE